MSYANIRSALQGRLQAIAGTGNVFPHLRWTDDDVDAPGFADFIDGDAVNFFQFTRTRFADVRKGLLHRNHDIVIFGFHSSSDSDATELLFQDLLEAIADDLEQGDRTLGGTCTIVHPPEVSPIEFIWFGPVFCHTAMIRITVEEIIET